MNSKTTHLVQGKYLFTDLADIEMLNKLFERFSKSTGYAINLLSHPKQDSIIHTGWQKACTLFHHSNEASNKCCIRSNSNLASKLTELNDYHVSHCELGLVEAATPIIIDGTHIATLITGQVLFHKADNKAFEEQAIKYGFSNLEEYIEAIQDVPIVKENEFMETVFFLKEMAVMIAKQGLSNLEAKEVVHKLDVAYKKAAESDKLKSSFLANMSHEIRTPMNGIIGFASLLRDPDLDRREQDEFISIIEKSGYNLLNVITDLIDVSVIQSGQLDVTITEFDINTKLQDIRHIFEQELTRKKIDLVLTHTIDGMESVVKTDQEKFYKVLSNIIKNAIKYTDDGSIDYGGYVKDDNIIIYVRDTGCGIPKEKYTEIFKHFIQVDENERRAREGSGVGLAICKAYVEKLGGQIWVESTLGIGSQFYFTIPLQAHMVEV